MRLSKNGLAQTLVSVVTTQNYTQNYKCALTGRELTPDKAALDHCVPVSRGGSLTDADNLQVLHVEVNAAKGALTNAEFIALCREVVAFVETRANAAK